jgi:hypothetical protein
MGSIYPRKKSLWLAYQDQTGKRISKASGYKLGQEKDARALLDELERRVSESIAPPVVTGARASAAVDRESPASIVNAAGLTVQAYGERWINGRRNRVESVADEEGRLKNHVYSRIGHMLIRDVRPRHIRDLILDPVRVNEFETALARI